MVQLTGLCLCAEAGVRREDARQGWEVRSLLSLFFFFVLDDGWSGGAERRFTPETSLPPRVGKQKGLFSPRSTVTCEAAVNVGHVSGLLPLRLSAFALPGSGACASLQNYAVNFLIHVFGTTARHICMFAATSDRRMSSFESVRCQLGRKVIPI